jgi:titin
VGSLDPQTDAPPPPTNTGASTTFDAETLIDRVSALVRSSTQIQLAWEAVPKAIGYTIDRWGDGADPPGWARIAKVDVVTTFTDAGLEADTTYYYRVAAVTEDGVAPPSDVVSATTSISPPAATTLTALATATTIELTWLEVADETAYRIERSLHGSSDWTPIGTTGQDVTTYTDAALVVDVMYRYRVVATNAGGDSTPSNVVSAKVTVKVTTPPDDSPPPEPDGEKPPKKETEAPPMTEEDPVAPESPDTEDAVATESSVVASS